MSTHTFSPSSIQQWNWTPAEKTIAHRAFDKALKQELDLVIRETRKRATQIKEPSDLWVLERWLGERRREIDGTFDFRYSALPIVFAGLLRDGRLDERDLAGLDQQKLETIRSMASVLGPR